jgi:hypothetical protein
MVNVKKDDRYFNVITGECYTLHHEDSRFEGDWWAVDDAGNEIYFYKEEFETLLFENHSYIYQDPIIKVIDDKHLLTLRLQY